MISQTTEEELKSQVHPSDTSFWHDIRIKKKKRRTSSLLLLLVYFSVSFLRISCVVSEQCVAARILELHANIYSNIFWRAHL